MMKQVSLLALLVAMAACSGSSPNPVNGNPGEGGTDPENPIEPGPEFVIPAELAQNVERITLDVGDPDDPLDDKLLVTGVPLDEGGVPDGDSFAATYDRNPTLDVAGYQAFSVQDDRLDRIYVAVSRTSDDGSVRASATGDGGQFNRFFRGAAFERLTDFSFPDVTDQNGLVSYAGTYAGVTNLTAIENNIRQPLNPGDPPETWPDQPRQTEGKVFLNVDFADNQVNGTIYDRQFTDGKPLTSLSLADAQMDESGLFTGTVEVAGRPDLGGLGTHGGIVGGENASAVAGAIHMDTVFSPEANDPLDNEFDRESGVFVLPRCGLENTPDICDGLGDLESPPQ